MNNMNIEELKKLIGDRNLTIMNNRFCDNYDLETIAKRNSITKQRVGQIIELSTQKIIRKMYE